MAYKRNVDRLPIPPRDAKVQNVVCHFCIVGCGYHAVSWPVDRQGGPQPDRNLFGEDLTQPQPAPAAQRVTDRVVQAGIKGILNFAPVPIRIPAGIVLEDIDITSHLERVAFFTTSRADSPGEGKSGRGRMVAKG